MGMYSDERRPVVDASKDGRTKQSFGPTCNINRLVAQYKKTGQFAHVAVRPGLYADVAEMGDYHVAMNKVCAANEAFAALPVLIRERFRNDPAEMVAFLQDPGNRAEAEKLGMLKAVVKPEGSGKAEDGAGGASKASGAGGAGKAADGAGKAS